MYIVNFLTSNGLYTVSLASLHHTDYHSHHWSLVSCMLTQSREV